MKKLLTYIKTAFVVAGLVTLPLFATAPASAINVFEAGCDAAGQSGGTPAGGGTGTPSGGGQSQICGAASGDDDFVKMMSNIINAILLVLGIIAVIMIIIGGIRYTTSNGDPGSTKAAKDTILYAVIGLIVAILAYAIVAFVLNAFK